MHFAPKEMEGCWGAFSFAIFVPSYMLWIQAANMAIQIYTYRFNYHTFVDSTESNQGYGLGMALICLDEGIVSFFIRGMCI